MGLKDFYQYVRLIVTVGSHKKTSLFTELSHAFARFYGKTGVIMLR